MKNNPRKTVRIICVCITIISIILLVCIFLVDHLGITSMQGVITKLTEAHLYISCILSGVIYRLSKKYK